MEFKQFAKRLKLSQPVYERVAKRWAELGFTGPVPAIHSFEQSDTLKGH